MVYEVSFRRSRIFANMFLCRDYKDSQIWKPSTSRELLAKAFYSAFEGTHPHRAPYSLVWLGLAPP